jgi:hypothetical protein
LRALPGGSAPSEQKTDKTSSPQRQGDRDLRAAADAGGHIIAWADDWEVSGATDPMTRKGLGPWLRGEMGPYDGIVAPTVDRVGRNVRDTLNTQTLLTGQDRVVVTADHAGVWDFSDPNQENVLIGDDDQRRIIGRGFPDPFPLCRHPRGPLVQRRDSISEHQSCLFRREREVVEARGPRLEFHSSFHVDAPQDHVAAAGEVGDDDVEDPGFPGPHDPADQRVAPQQQHADRPAIFGQAGSGFVTGPAAMAPDSHPPVTAMTAAA